MADIKSPDTNLGDFIGGILALDRLSLNLILLFSFANAVITCYNSYLGLQYEYKSIVIPLYNSQSIIERVLDSIKNQTKIDLVKEIIIVNEGSKDNSEEVVLQYVKRNEDLPIRVIMKENGGV